MEAVGGQTYSFSRLVNGRWQIISNGPFALQILSATTLEWQRLAVQMGFETISDPSDLVGPPYDILSFYAVPYTVWDGQISDFY